VQRNAAGFQPDGRSSRLGPLRLPEQEAEVFYLRCLEDMSYQEIATIVGRSLPSVKTDIHRARLEVRKLVKDYLKV